MDISSDKIATLTEGKMVARMAWIPCHGTYSVKTTNDPYNPSADSVFSSAGQATARLGYAVHRVPFGSSAKKMLVLCRSRETPETRIFIQGAVEPVLDTCSSMTSDDEKTAVSITGDAQRPILRTWRSWPVVGCACSPSPAGLPPRPYRPRISAEVCCTGTGLSMRGLAGIYAPPRLGSRPSVFKCYQAGIAVHILTGDPRETGPGHHH